MSFIRRAVNWLNQPRGGDAEPLPPGPADVNQAIPEFQGRCTSGRRHNMPNKRRPKALQNPSSRPATPRKTQRGRRIPITPTTRKKIAKKAKHTRIMNRRQAEQDAEKVLQDYRTYWRVLRSGRGYRSLIGASSWKKPQIGQGSIVPTASGLPCPRGRRIVRAVEILVY